MRIPRIRPELTLPAESFPTPGLHRVAELRRPLISLLSLTMSCTETSRLHLWLPSNVVGYCLRTSNVSTFVLRNHLAIAGERKETAGAKHALINYTYREPVPNECPWCATRERDDSADR